MSELAATLGVDVDCLSKLSVGILEEYGTEKWTFPERDANGQFIGISKRSAINGEKRTISGSSRGLTFADDWNKTPGPIYLVEGGSDTAALMTMGLCCIGRPSNRSGIDHLAELLKDHQDRQIIVLGERDLKKDTGKWPGREGAIATAKKLAVKLNIPISWALPPEGYKDAREYLNGSDPKPAWKLDLETIEPPPAPEPLRLQGGPKRSLDDWRTELAETRREIMKKPGCYFDRSPTGAGKSTADQVAMPIAGSSLTLVHTHENGDELLAEYKKAGFDQNEAAKLPNGPGVQ